MNNETLSLARLVGKLLKEQGLTIAVAESLTAGYLQAALGSVSGSSAYYLGGVTAYSMVAKERLFNLDRAHLEETNCVSSKVAEGMAEGVVEMFRADIGIGTTGYAEPDPDRGILAPMAYWHIHHPQGIQMPTAHGEFAKKATRIRVQEGVVSIVLSLLLHSLGE